MGFNVADPELFETAMLAFVPFVLSRPRVVHLELRDDRIDRELADRMGLEAKTSGTWRTDLRPSEDDIIAGFNQSKRRNTRLAERRGVTISEADDLDFASDYFDQLIDVFAKQNLTPTYDEERVRAMMRLVQPAGDLLCLRARNEDGICIATAIYVFHGTKSVFWGNASWRGHQKLYPNEALHWYAMRWLKKAGVEEHEWGGGGDYKKGYGGAPVVVEGYSASRNALLRHGRVAAERAFYGSRDIRARIKDRLAG